ncbi:MAG: C-N hydrolase family amidase [Methanosaeta sp. PtaU1.Bin112]|nr:MAG: C-N hydrolase family amidase [Methanosaeta sp. PtaU1.Bin112]
MPEREPRTGIFYNSAALMGPKGDVVARHRKLSPAFRENLWAAKGNLPVPVVQTEFGALSMVICADSYSYRPARIAALQGARILLVPANWPPMHHNPEKFWRARALENEMYILACNRTGMDKVMDCNPAQSFIVNPQGEAAVRISSPEDTIIYGSLPLDGLRAQNPLSERRPQCYGNITLDPYSHLSIEFLLGLPKAAEFCAATIQLRSQHLDTKANVKSVLGLVDDALKKAVREGERAINLIVLPELSLSGALWNSEQAEICSEEIPGRTTDLLAKKAQEKDLFVVLGMAERAEGGFYNSSVLIGPGSVLGKYRAVHLSARDRSWASPGESGFATFDLPFARIGMLLGYDLLFPEAADSLAKLGSDMLCVPALWDNTKTRFIWESRQSEQMHLAVANQWGDCGGLYSAGESLLCSYSRYQERVTRLISPATGDAINIVRLETKDTREKRFLENIDYGMLLDLSGQSSSTHTIRLGHEGG